MEPIVSIFDLLSTETIERFRQAFLKAANMQISFADAEHRRYKSFYAAEARTEFCRLLNENHTALKCCLKSSNLGAKEAFKRGEALVYECHAGLVEIVVPIIVNHTHIGNVYSGQILTQRPTDEQVENVVARYAQYGISREALRKAYQQIPVIAESDIETISNLLHIVVDFIVETEYNAILRSNYMEEQKKLNEAIPYVLNQFLGRVIRNEVDELLQMKSKMQVLGLESDYDIIFYIKSTMTRSGTVGSRNGQAAYSENRVSDALRQFLGNYSGTLVMSLEKERFVLFMVAGRIPQATQLRNGATEFVNQMKSVVERAANCSLSVGISRVSPLYTQLGQAYQQAKLACLSGMMLSDGLVVHADDVLLNLEDLGAEMLNEEAVRKAVLTADSDTLITMYEKEFERILSSRNPSIDQLKSMQIEYLEKIFEAINEVIDSTDESASWKLKFLNEVLLIEREDDLFFWMRENVSALVQWVRNVRQGHNQKIICMAKEFIERNYFADISLNDVADYVHLSVSYFSWLFKRETHFTCRGYLTKWRIDKAKRLLKSTSKSVQTIALEVGYSNPNYFSQVFLKQEGIRPTEYRHRAKDA